MTSQLTSSDLKEVGPLFATLIPSFRAPPSSVDQKAIMIGEVFHSLNKLGAETKSRVLAVKCLSDGRSLGDIALALENAGPDTLCIRGIFSPVSTMVIRTGRPFLSSAIVGGGLASISEE